MLRKLNWIIWGCGAFCLGIPVLALEIPFSASGIDAVKLRQLPYNLTGRKIAIGQVEIGRPGMFGRDKAVSKNRSVSLAGVFLRNQIAKSNIGVDPHAYHVASIMVSQAKGFSGVAPDAKLYSSAVGVGKNIGQPEECLSAQHIALQNSDDVRAINFSFGEPLSRDPRPEAVLDGQALLTLCVDWSSRQHNVLYIIAGNQGRGGIPIPTDNFNGLNVAFSSRREGIFDKVDVSNLVAGASEGVNRRLAGREINLGSRLTTGLVAPGNNLSVLDPEGRPTKVTGTSFAAPQVTATVALLQEFGDRQLRNKQANWSLASRRQEVMKAVLLNSADKTRDLGDGLRLGMTRTLIDKQNQDWLASEAYKNHKTPLDRQMGAGHLNAYRAYQQFSAGQWSPEKAVPPIGWDYRTLSANSRTVEYKLSQPLKQNSFVAVTLVWNRIVELEDSNKNDLYDAGEQFRDFGFNNLDLYLVKADTSDREVGSLCSSVSEVDNVEHIFCHVPTTDQYKIRVQLNKKVHQTTQPYALTWWSVPEQD